MSRGSSQTWYDHTMRQIALHLENVGKLYQMGELNTQQTFREALMSGFRRSARALGTRFGGTGERAASAQTFWALKDVSLDVHHGELVGIVGRNGAGKSTLLKILSRVTEPTRGRVDVYRRIGSLLEVGTGFHPELTGRENIYLNGAILGMSKTEIARKFDEIVAFSEVERFLETPVKRYSSGMYVRLAYAVAAHLEPEILLVDEVLAVGDIDFQKKCIGSLKTVAQSGRTVLVVSHNMALIEALCTRVAWIHEGEIRADGAVHDVVTRYLSGTRVVASGSLADHPRRRPKGDSMFTGIEIVSADGSGGHDIRIGSGLTVHLDVQAGQRISKPWIGVQIRSSHDQLVFHCANREAGYELPPMEGGCRVTCHIDQMNLLPDRYFIDLILADMANTIYDEVAGADYFDVRAADILGTGMPMARDYGLVYFPSRWEVGDAVVGDGGSHGST